MATDPDDRVPPSDVAAAMAQAMLQIVEGFGPVFDAGAGIRVQLESEGWSPTMAEQIAGEVVLGAIRTAINQIGKGS